MFNLDMCRCALAPVKIANNNFWSRPEGAAVECFELVHCVGVGSKYLSLWFLGNVNNDPVGCSLQLSH